jgi:pimeloyl-ACP methyl ester carboxylesterase
MNNSPYQPKSSFVSVNGVRLHFVESGEGPAVIFCHGFPEIWRTWRQQLSALSQAGYRAIALDMRGHGQSDSPTALTSFSVLHTVGDVIGLMDELGIEKAVIAGHDAGTTTAYNATLMRPDRFLGVVGLSVPFVPRGKENLLAGMIGQMPPHFYMRYFQTPDAPERELDADPRESLRRIYHHNSGEAPGTAAIMLTSEQGRLLDNLAKPLGEMGFLPDSELDLYAEAYARSGFRGGLNGYRVFDLNWELLAPWQGQGLPVPALFLGGDRDIVLQFPGFLDAAQRMGDSFIAVGAGHWIQEEQPEFVNDRLLRFLSRVCVGSGV